MTDRFGQAMIPRWAYVVAGLTLLVLPLLALLAFSERNRLLGGIVIMWYRNAQQSDAHEPPPRVSVSMVRVTWLLHSLPAPGSGGMCGRWAKNALAASAQAYTLRLCRRSCKSGRTGSTFTPMREWTRRISMCGRTMASPSFGWARPSVSHAIMGSGLLISDVLSNWCSSTTTNC